MIISHIMHKITKRLFLFTFFMMHTIPSIYAMDASQSKEKIGIHTIQSITDIEKIVDDIRSQHPNDSIVVAFDWDNTLSLVDGCSLPLRDGEKTSQFIEKLMINQRVYPIIITSRLRGYGENEHPDAKKTKDKVLYEMRYALPSLKQTPYLLHEDEFKIDDGDKHNTVIIDKGIVFAGTHTDTDSIKGPALGHLMANDQFLKNVDHVIFIDNDMYHINNVSDYFKDSENRRKLTLVHYPQLPDRLSDKSLCESIPLGTGGR